jgi:DNA-binding transcriptional LysR family regulator
MVLSLQERLSQLAPRVFVAASTRSRPLDLKHALREGGIDAAVDWLPIEGDDFRESVLFNDSLIAVVRRGHPALRRPASRRTLEAGRFVRLRPRVEGEHPLEGVREWQKLDLRYALDVSEILEIFMVANRSNLFALIPKSMESFARERFGLRAFGWAPKAPAIPIRLIWHATRDDDPAHIFLRAQTSLVVKESVSPK